MDSIKLNKIIEKGLRKNWTTDRLLLETGLSRVELRGLINRAKESTLFFDPFVVDLGSPFTRTGDAVVIGDVHVPLTDYVFSSKITLVADYYNIKRLIIGGDFFNFDLLSRYPHITPPVTWENERTAARTLISEWLLHFDEIDIVFGNHDRRLQKVLSGTGIGDEYDLVYLLGNSDRVKWSGYSYMNLETTNGNYRITHPKNYSVNNLTVAEKLAMKFSTNVISFHEHYFGISVSRYGGHKIINGGCVMDPRKAAYVALEDSVSADMINGFVVIRDGYPELFGDESFTDYRRFI